MLIEIENEKRFNGNKKLIFAYNYIMVYVYRDQLKKLTQYYWIAAIMKKYDKN